MRRFPATLAVREAGRSRDSSRLSFWIDALRVLDRVLSDIEDSQTS